jgi:hypothetical protein
MQTIRNINWQYISGNPKLQTSPQANHKKENRMTTSSSLTVSSDADHTNRAENTLADTFSTGNLPTWVLGITIMGIVTGVERALDAVDTGFALEWVILSVVALLTFALLARAVVRVTCATQAWFGDYAAHAARTRADVKLLELARCDPNLMREMLDTQQRANTMLKNYRLRAGAL